jgi:ubiquinone/menaquinone biosynthesis C-methylase UbiE
MHLLVLYDQSSVRWGLQMEQNKPDVTEITRLTYDQIASGYIDTINHLISDSWISRFEKSLLDKLVNLIQAPDRPYLKILDIGCGNGKDTFYLSQKSRVIPTGLDYSSGMLSEARTTYPNIDFVQMDMRKLAFKDNHFDGVWANGCIYHVPKVDFQQLLSEVRRVLKPEGILSFNFKLGAGERLEQNPKSYAGRPRFYSYYELQEMKNELIQASFTIIETQLYPQEILGDKILHIWTAR